MVMFDDVCKGEFITRKLAWRAYFCHEILLKKSGDYYNMVV